MTARVRSIVFRFEFGGATGWGHLARCAALATEMQARGRRCVAWTAGDLGGAPEDLRTPFSEVRADLATGGADWIVVDHYGISDAELRDLRHRSGTARLLAIDDDAIRSLDAADIVVNSRLGLDAAPYASARLLLGERYVLLRPGLRRPAKVNTPQTVGVLVMLGGTDSRELTATVLDALADADASCTPVVLRSRALPGTAVVARALDRFPAHTWLERADAATLAGWARVCRFAVTACGGAVYELAFLGVPFVGLVVADNQAPLARAVEARWRLPVVDAREQDPRAEIVAGIKGLLAGPAGARPAWYTEIDGLGAARVADAIEGL